MTSPAEILASARIIAVVGASRHEEKSAYTVPLHIKRHGWHVIPINPHAGEIWGARAYPSLAALAASGDLDAPIDIVNVFRPSELTAAVVAEAAAVGARAVWLQQGIASPEARAVAAAAGMAYIEDNCIAVTRAVFQVSPVESGDPSR